MTLSRRSLLTRIAFRPLASYGNGFFSFEEWGCGKGVSGLAEPCFMSCLPSLCLEVL